MTGICLREHLVFNKADKVKHTGLLEVKLVISLIKSFLYGKFLINKFFTFVAKQSGARNEKSMKTRKVRLPYYGKMHCARGHRQVVRQWLPKPSSAGSNPVARSKDTLRPFGAFFMRGTA